MDSKQQLRLLWSSAWWLGLVALCAAGAAYFASNARTPVYESSALSQILPRSQTNGVTLSTDQLLQVTNFYAEVAKTDAISAAARRESGDRGPLTVEVIAQPNLLVLEFVGASPNPRFAAFSANTYARAFEEAVRVQQESERRRTLAEPRQRVEEIRRQLRSVSADSAVGLSLQSELQSLQARLIEESVTPPDRVRLLQTALPSSDAVSPKPVRDGLLALILALVVGVTVVLLRDLVTDRFSSVEEAALDLQLPVLGELPKARADKLEALEAFRKLRAQVEFSLNATNGRELGRTAGARGGHDRDGRNVVLVTSPEPSAGKSYITANLARALAADGKHVIAVDGDLRRPTLHEQLGVKLEPGLSNALHAGRGDEWDLDIQSATVTRDVSQRGGALDVFAAGGLPGGATAERLSSERMGTMLESLRGTYDFVVLDSPPVLAIVDAVVLSRYASAVVLVIDAGRSRRRHVRRAVQTLRAIDAPILGIVFNRSKSSDAEYGYYGRPRAEVREAELTG